MTDENTVTGASFPPDNPRKSGSYRGPFAIMTTLFFIWGFMTAWNDILIPRFKEAFTLNYFQAMLVQFAFFGAYFIGALSYFVISAIKGDPIAKIGYKNAVVISLLVCAVGSLFFWPAANAVSYPLFLTGIFIVGLGFAMLQIAANPYVTILGPERTASSRLNLAQGFNSVGTTLGPLIGGYLIFEYFNKAGTNGAESVRVPYLAFCLVFLILAAVFLFVHLPHIGEGKIERGAKALRPSCHTRRRCYFYVRRGRGFGWQLHHQFSRSANHRGVESCRCQQICVAVLGRHVDRKIHGCGGTKRDETADEASISCGNPDRCFCYFDFPERVGDCAKLFPSPSCMLAAVPIRKSKCRTHAYDFHDSDYCAPRYRYYIGRKSCDVVRCRSGIVHLDWMVKHIFACARRDRNLQKPGFFIARSGNPRRRDFASTARSYCRSRRTANFLHRAFNRIRLCRILRTQRS